MKKNILAVITFTFFISCNNSGEKANPLESKADSLQKEVIKDHDIAMPKSMKISGVKKKIEELIDSINSLPEKQFKASVPFKIELGNLRNDLSGADSVMHKWMDEFNLDSFSNNAEQRIKYLAEEKIKIENVKNAVLNSLQKADSILKKKS